MRTTWFAMCGFLGIVAACGGEATPTPVAPPPAAAAPVSPPNPTTSTSVEVAPPVVDEATLKKQKEQAALDADMASMEEAAKKEAARWTPELHAEAKSLSEASYPNLKAAFKKVLVSSIRGPGNADRDKFRHPLETLTFFGVTPSSHVIEFGGGGGWYTEILAPVLAKKGKLFTTSLDPNGPADQRSTLYGRRFQRFMEKAPELTSKIETILLKDPENPDLGNEGKIDVVLALREMHGWVNSNRLEKNLAQVHKALKKGGVFGVVDHRAKPGADPVESAKKGYLPEAWVIEKVEAAGFKLAGKSEVNANPKDTADYPEGVWTLPPSYRLGDKDRAKYTEIGESDRMTLKFTRK